MNNTQTFLVGGAVRDLLMGLVPKDRDYVVVGTTADQMLANGFSQVGADFPVFLHPETGEEFALARRERKTGTGYNGFTCEFGTDVTLEEDLARRDLTINAMALKPESMGGNLLIDPFGGKSDLDNKVLRHVSADAFREDPVRVLRLARFRARFGAEWTVDPMTVETVRHMGQDGVLAELTAERVWKELSRALTEPFPRLFFDTLRECSVLFDLFPEVANLMLCTENPKWHPEGNTYEHTMLVLTAASKLNPGSLEAAFFALTHDFGKAAVPAHLHPKFYGHAELGVPLVEAFCDRLKVDSKLRKHARLMSRFHMHMHQLDKMKASTFVKMFEQMDAFRDDEVVEHLMWLGAADQRGRLGFHDAEFGHLFLVTNLWAAASSVRFADLDVPPPPVTKPERVKELMFRARTKEVAKWQK